MDGGLIFGACVAAGLVIVVGRTQLRDRQADKVRENYADRPVLFDGPVDVFHRLPTGWSLKRLALMRIVVRPGLVDVQCRFPISGTNWVFPLASARIGDEGPAVPRKPWLVLESVGDTRQALALLGREDHAQMESAIRASGVTV